MKTQYAQAEITSTYLNIYDFIALFKVKLSFCFDLLGSHNVALEGIMVT